MPHVRFALRRLRQQPGFAVTAIAALALGIAAPTALFAVVNATLLRPLPYQGAGDIYTVRTTMTDGRFTIGLVASAEMGALRRTTDLVVDSALIQSFNGTIETEAGARQVSTYGVTLGFFEFFGLPMAQGRSFVDDDTKSWFGSRLVLSHRTWLSIFGGDPSIVGKTIKYGAGPGSLVVGVAPASFAIPRNADVWMVLPPSPENVGHQYDAFIRLKPGATPDDVQARLAGMWSALAQMAPDQEQNRAFVITPLLSSIVGDLGPIVVIAFAATAVLLLLAIVNVANLLLARSVARSREMAVRTALGAGRRDLFTDLLVESLVIAAAATAIALPLAYAAVRAIVAIGGNRLPRVEGLQLHPAVFAFSALAMVIAGVAVGLAPLVTMRRSDLTELMNEGGRGGLQGRTTRRVLNAMIVVEVALAIALVAGAARLLLSMNNLLTLDPGFVAAGRLAIDVDLPVRPYVAEPERMAAWQASAEQALRGLGATAVGIASSVPLRREWDSTTFVDITGRPTDPAHRPNARLRVVDPGFFPVTGIKIVQGRAFTIDDRRGGDPVVLVNQAWAKKFLPGLDPLKERVSPGAFSRHVEGKFVPMDAAIVGVVADVPYVSLPVPAEPTVYIADAQTTRPRKTILITSADGRPESLIPGIRRELGRLDSHVAMDFEMMPDVVSASLAWPKLGLLLMVTFGLLGLVLAATGIFGVIAFVSSQRTGEMAVRLALGGTPGHIFGLVVSYGVRFATAGLAAGVLLAWWLGGPMSPYVYGVRAGNPIVLMGSAAIVFAVAIAATLPSARRASMTAPAKVFRT